MYCYEDHKFLSGNQLKWQLEKKKFWILKTEKKKHSQWNIQFNFWLCFISPINGSLYWRFSRHLLMWHSVGRAFGSLSLLQISIFVCKFIGWFFFLLSFSNGNRPYYLLLKNHNFLCMISIFGNSRLFRTWFDLIGFLFCFEWISNVKWLIVNMWTFFDWISSKSRNRIMNWINGKM